MENFARQSLVIERCNIFQGTAPTGNDDDIHITNRLQIPQGLGNFA